MCGITGSTVLPEQTKADRNHPNKSANVLTVELEVFVHDKAARQAERHVVIVLQGLEERVVQVLRFVGNIGRQ